jgi:hypothetical protein
MAIGNQHSAEPAAVNITRIWLLRICVTQAHDSRFPR